MKKYIFLIALLISQLGFSQILDPVEWTTKVEQISDSEYELTMEAFIDSGWHLYAQEIPEGGPIATEFILEGEGTAFELVGSVKEGEGHTEFDQIFEMEIKYFEDYAQFKQRIRFSDQPLNIQGYVSYMVCDDSRCLPPTDKDLFFDLGAHSVAVDEVVAVTTESDDVTNDLSVEGESIVGDIDWISLFILAFLFGFTALLTPCVFPMIPLTVSFFTKQSKNRSAGITNAIIFGVSIVVIYVLLGTVVTAIFGAGALNALSTNVWFNLAFFVLLVVFAISFLGAFEITLPSSWGNKADEKANKGGLAGIFFMALALAIVSFSCTGPIVGTILVQAASGGNQLGPVVGMLGFSLAIALPFTLFAAFPGWMNSLPKSGGWLNTVKVVLGFLELAFAFKFLSNADLVLQLHLFEREVFIAIWVVIFGVLSLYLLGKLQLPHDSKLGSISVGRLLLGLLSLSFTVYMIPGLWGAPLKLISAFPPPQHYSESPYGVGNAMGGGAAYSENLPEGAHLMAPHNIVAFNDYDLGLAYAKSVGKPVMLDFTGHACVNCRKMEQNVWVEDRVLNVLKNDVVLISLYVDDKRDLDQPIASKTRAGKQLTTIGQKWAEFQAVRFKANSQPFYVILDSDGKQLGKPIAYTPDADVYYQWLQIGIKN